MDKLHSYQGWSGRCHEWKDDVKSKYSNWKEEHPGNVLELVKNKVKRQPGMGNGHADTEKDYSHVYRRKTRLELIRVSAAVMGIEFSYAAETAFVSPTLLKIGVEHRHMTLVWALSPIIGFLLTPILGSLSDKCRLSLGRRRPFIILLSIGILIGLLLVPNGEDIGYALGDYYPYSNDTNTTKNPIPHRLTASETEMQPPNTVQKSSHPWGIFFTILGTVLLDFDADSCQSPARAYLLDVTLPEDHAKGLSTFTIMAGLGGFMGYSLGGINWDVTSIGILLGGHVRAVFTLITFIFILCVLCTVTSFKEIPLPMLEGEIITPHDFLKDEEAEEEVTNKNKEKDQKMEKRNSSDATLQVHVNVMEKTNSYGTLGTHLEEPPRFNNKRRYTMPPLPTSTKEKYTTVDGDNIAETSFNSEQQTTNVPHPAVEEGATLIHYLKSIVFMPHSLRMVCLTNLFCWMAHVCYSLYFTDFVGEAVFQGDPRALEGEKHDLYEEGVRFGCWGMAMYSLSCACYSSVIEKLIKKFGAKKVYIGGLLFYCCGMALMAFTKNRIGVIVFSLVAGVMYSTLFTMPYLLVAHYHAQGTFELNTEGEAKLGTEVRGLGTDIAIVSSMVFLAQFILSLCMGSIVSIAGTTTSVVAVASFLSFCGAIAATQIMYLEL